MNGDRIDVNIPVQPWLRDHAFGGRAVLPAVETLLLLAGEIQKVQPQVDIRVMEQAYFPRFLELDKDAEAINGFFEWSREENGSIRTKFLSRVQLKAMARIIVHGEVLFPCIGSSCMDSGRFAIPPLGDSVSEVDTVSLYRELVPFGPAYQSLTGSLRLAADGARGIVLAPELPGTPVRNILGSSFPLDGALQAACVQGQQYVDFIPFPVGFERRIISRPTQPGSRYRIRVQSVLRSQEELVFDLEIVGREGAVYERISAVRMRDVGAGVTPPQWIKRRAS